MGNNQYRILESKKSLLGENMFKECVLEKGKECMECGSCNVCDLDVDKICDNCCRCLGEADYSAVQITEIILPQEIRMKRKKMKRAQDSKTIKH